jgi:hypothetical protein
MATTIAASFQVFESNLETTGLSRRRSRHASRKSVMRWRDGYRSLTEGQRVAFEADEGPKGPQATSVTPR